MSFQLKFDPSFNNVYKDINYWKNIEDIPEDISKFIKNKSKNLQIYEDKSEEFYCSECLSKLKNGYCKKCHKRYPKVDISRIEINPLVNNVVEIKKNNYSNLTTSINYLAFDFKDNLIYLYYIVDRIHYSDSIPDFPLKVSNLSIDGIFVIYEHELYNIKDYEMVSYKTLINALMNIDDTWDKYEKYFSISGFLYPKNLNKLKKTFYKYTPIWVLSNDSYRSLEHLSIIPLETKGYDFLIKNKLYNLSYAAHRFNTNAKSFKGIFGIDKKFLPFIKKYDLDYSELEALKLYPKEDIKTIREISYIDYMLDYLYDKYEIDKKKIVNYFINKNLSFKQIHEYGDYIYLLKEMGFDLTDKTKIFPSNLLEEHNKLTIQYEVNNNPEIDSKLKYIASICSINNYEDDTYIIRPALSLQDLIEESKNQHNCVRTYASRIVDGERQIYFMRLKKERDKSLVTIEVRNNKVVQARIKYNDIPDQELLNIIKKWEKKILPIEIK